MSLEIDSGKCRICLCTNRRACDEGCFWVDKAETLCSSCSALNDFTRDDVLAIANDVVAEARHFLNVHEGKSVGRKNAREIAVDVIAVFERRGFKIVRVS